MIWKQSFNIKVFMSICSSTFAVQNSTCIALWISGGNRREDPSIYTIYEPNLGLAIRFTRGPAGEWRLAVGELWEAHRDGWTRLD